MAATAALAEAEAKAVAVKEAAVAVATEAAKDADKLGPDATKAASAAPVTQSMGAASAAATEDESTLAVKAERALRIELEAMRRFPGTVGKRAEEVRARVAPLLATPGVDAALMGTVASELVDL